MLKLFSIFHLNLAYSSISESKRKEVIERCFLAASQAGDRRAHPRSDRGHPVYTLELVSRLDPSWLRALRSAVRSHLVEFVGSGYSQIVAPIVPAGVNEWNLEVGAQQYERLFGASSGTLVHKRTGLLRRHRGALRLTWRSGDSDGMEQPAHLCTPNGTMNTGITHRLPSGPRGTASSSSGTILSPFRNFSGTRTVT